MSIEMMGHCMKPTSTLIEATINMANAQDIMERMEIEEVVTVAMDIKTITSTTTTITEIRRRMEPYHHL